MQFGLFTVLVLVLMDIADSSKVVKGRRHKRRSRELTLGCGKGCEACSEVNGCIKCLPRLFMLLERNDIRQIGVCLQSCPPGYYGDRSREMNKCTKCRVANCENCFSKNFCTECNDGFYLHKGVCYSTCPDGFVAENGTMECNSEQCEMSEWGSWNPCLRPAKHCWKKKGTQVRSRKVLKAPLGEASLCPATKDKRKCTMLQTPCPKVATGKPKKENQGKEKKSRSRNKEESGNKKRKNQQRVTSMPITPSLPAKQL